MPISNYPKGFSAGVNIRGVPVLNTYGGSVFWVDSNNGSDGNKGTYDRPFATLNKAMDFVTANKGDIIFLKPGHTEDLSSATGAVVDVAGVSIVGMGIGSDQPSFTYSNASGSFEIDAANTIIENVNFKSSVTAVTVGINVDASNVLIRNCLFDFEDSGDDFITHISVEGVDYVTIQDCSLLGEVGHTDTGRFRAILLNNADHVRIIGNYIFGDFRTSPIEGTTDTDNGGTGECSDLRIEGNSIYNGHTSTDTQDASIGLCIDIDTASTGICAYNNLGHLGITAHYALDPGSMLCVENYAVNAINETGVVTPVTPST